MTAHDVFLVMVWAPILALILMAAGGVEPDSTSETAMGWTAGFLLLSILVGIVGLVLT